MPRPFWHMHPFSQSPSCWAPAQAAVHCNAPASAAANHRNVNASKKNNKIGYVINPGFEKKKTDEVYLPIKMYIDHKHIVFLSGHWACNGSVVSAKRLPSKATFRMAAEVALVGLKPCTGAQHWLAHTRCILWQTFGGCCSEGSLPLASILDPASVCGHNAQVPSASCKLWSNCDTQYLGTEACRPCSENQRRSRFIQCRQERLQTLHQKQACSATCTSKRFNRHNHKLLVLWL